MPLRRADEGDLDTVIELIHGLAEYEREPDAVRLERDTLRGHLFGPRPYAEVILAETEAGESAGFALFFHNFSTWEGRPGIYLEDLFVIPEERRGGIGSQLLARLAQIAVERKCGRMEWSVLDWNTPARDLYFKLGAKAMDAWTVFRMTPDAFGRLAQEGVPGKPRQ